MRMSTTPPANVAGRSKRAPKRLPTATPMNDSKLPGLNRRLTGREYRQVLDHMLELGLDGYLQEKEAADSAYTPAFMDEESVKLFPDSV